MKNDEGPVYFPEDGDPFWRIVKIHILIPGVPRTLREIKYSNYSSKRARTHTREGGGDNEVDVTWKERLDAYRDSLVYVCVMHGREICIICVI